MLLKLTTIVAVALTGLYAGGLFFFAIAPSTLRLPPEAYLLYWQGLNNDYQVLAPLLILSVVPLLVVTVCLRRQGRLALAAAIAAATLVAGSIAVTVTQMVPLNELANGWTPETLPADFDAVRARWWDLHLLRTAMATAGFALLVTAVLNARTTLRPAAVEHPAEAATIG